MRSLLFCDVTRRRLRDIYRRFGTAQYVPSSRVKRSGYFYSFSAAWPSNVGQIDCPETSVSTIYAA